MRKSAKALFMLLALLAWSLSFPGNAATEARQAQFVPGEVMVKFQAHSEAAATLARAAESSPPRLDMLAPVVRKLSDQTAVPLLAKQILSGGWVLLAVDTDELTKQAVAALRKRESVVEIQLKDRVSQGVGMPSQQAIHIRFKPGSEDDGRIGEKLAGTSGNRFSEWLDEVGTSIGLPLTGHAASPREVVLTISFGELSGRLAERLRAMRETVESVELNYIMTIM
jgi:hypothetical protein